MIALRDVSYLSRVKSLEYQFHAQRCYGTLGVNGAGKSTLLKLLSGQFPHKKVSGEMYLNQMNLLQMQTKERAKYIAMLSQSIHLNFPYLAEDILAMGRYALGLSNQQTKAAFDLIVELLHLEPILKKEYHKLSGGQKQRLQLARVIFQLIGDLDEENERWLLLDEHAAGLDIYRQYQSFEVLMSIKQRFNIGIIAIIHDINLAAKYADNLLLLDQGELAIAGNAEKVLLSGEFSNAFQSKVEYLSEKAIYLTHPNRSTMS
ncbi:ATP-binding cassette domain-containing protein [Fangia hongkongensis]|uniref:ATP-binding cassette domain-containing protein n=1 Tax=Fangia hongkongensis TaxID=270495 RepID=UPI00036E9F3E|nr:ATP-binding cassette domain-containing protein [Fangia hongkongensis]MBK2124736.1 ATP-binding cassette domain-containing protein [Fangia hongkongensis]